MKNILMILIGLSIVACATPRHKQKHANHWTEKKAFLPGYMHDWEFREPAQAEANR
ncbi:MAG: hypothetical protein GY909_02290 [Oligoflexia bacterium]|nr:hypothetical protein [Oligoflexia bacterium]